MIHTILDPGNIYMVGFALMFTFAALVLCIAKHSLEKRGEETKLTMKPIAAFLGIAATMSFAVLAKATIFADFFDTYSIYAPGA